jgi:hypothetical protein
MPGHVNTYNGGMDKDTSKSKYPNTKYEHSENVRIVTDSGLSTGALENIRGNEFAKAFPSTPTLWVIEPGPLANDDPTIDKTQNILASRASTGNTFLSDSFTFKEEETLFQGIQQVLDNYNNTVPTTTPEALITYGNSDILNRIVLYSDDDIDVFTGLGSAYLTITKIDPMSDFTVIGSTNLRDDVILFTVADTYGAGQSGYGQLWKMNYDVQDPVNTTEIKILYNGKLEFSKDNPIEAVARYESANIQRTYWTDNNNPLRKINIKDPALLALRPVDLLLSPEVVPSPPKCIREQETGGLLPAGIWYTAYRLKKLGGGTSATSVVSTGVHVTSSSSISPGINNTIQEYESYAQSSPGSNTIKALDWKITDITPGYDTLEIYAIHKTSNNVHNVYLVEESFLDGANSTYEFTISDISNLDNLELSDIYDFDIDFDRVKTLTVKDNSLVVANVKESQFEINFDARAYRFDRVTNTTYAGNIDTTQDDWAVAEEAAVINPMNLDSTAKLELDNNLNYNWQYDDGSGTAVMGGTGPNVSYSFITEARLTLDRSFTVEQWDFTPGYSPFYVDSPALDVWINNDGFKNYGPGYKSYRNGRVAADLKGYLRDEVYRFGIVFYSKTGKPSEVKWIGDIRMPSLGTTQNPLPNGMVRNPHLLNFGTTVDPDDPTKTDNFNAAATFSYPLGIEFEVDVTSIKDQISGYSIVRAKRTDDDKAIIAQGILHEVTEIESNGDPVLVNSLGDNSVNIGVPGNPTGAQQGIDPSVAQLNYNNMIKPTTNVYCTFESPDLKFAGGSPLNETSQEYVIKPVGMASPISSADTQLGMKDIFQQNSTTTRLTGDDLWSRYQKNFSMAYQNANDMVSNDISAGNRLGAIDQIYRVGEGETDVNVGNGYKFLNWGYVLRTNGLFQVDQPELANSQISTGGTPISPGTNTLLFKMNNDVGYLFNAANGNFGTATYTLSSGFSSRFRPIVNIYREPTNRYGGDTFVGRKETAYISTGNFVKVDATSSNTTTKVYGGDIFLTIFDYKKLYSREAVPQISIAGISVSSSLDTPVFGEMALLESLVDPTMRIGSYLNNNRALTQGYRDNDSYTNYDVFYSDPEVQQFLVEGAGTEVGSEFDNRIYKSLVKANGELEDSWSIFKPYNNMDVDGVYGPINKIEVFNNTLMYWQDNGFGVVSMNPKEIIPNATGVSLEIGTGGGLIDYDYISNTVGCRHQWSVVKSKQGMYFFDANGRKFYRFTGRDEPLSDIKGMSTFFYNTLQGTVFRADNPIQFNGITATYDNRFNEVMFTFHSNDTDPTIQLVTTQTQVRPGQVQVTQQSGLSSADYANTIVYSEGLQAFTSFYSHHPRHYVNDGSKIFSQIPGGYDMYVHDEGERGKFYGTYHDSVIRLLVNPQVQGTKVFNNIEYVAQMTTSAGADIFDETWNTIKVYNEYQDSGVVTLIPDNNIKRRMRSWRLQVPRDINARIRNPYTFIEFVFVNNGDKRFICEDIITHYMPVPM